MEKQQNYATFAEVIKRFSPLMPLFFLLGSCSYSYDVIAVGRIGHITFEVAPTSRQQPTCLRRVEVSTPSGPNAEAIDGDDRDGVEHGNYWVESVSQDDSCTNRFPLRYGQHLSGHPLPEQGKVAAKKLLREVVYEVSTTTGATGYGGGRFVIHAGGEVENLPPESGLDLIADTNAD